MGSGRSSVGSRRDVADHSTVVSEAPVSLRPSNGRARPRQESRTEETGVKLMLELLLWMLVVGLVVAAFVLLAMAIGAVCLGALLWLFLAAAHDRVVTRGTGTGYWRWWADRCQYLLLAVDGDRDESALGDGVRRRTITRLEAQTNRLARRIERQAPRHGLLKDCCQGRSRNNPVAPVEN